MYFRANGLGILSDDDGMEGSYVFVTSGGTVFWVTAANIVSNCVVDIMYYPFDKQECHMIVSTSFITYCIHPFTNRNAT